MKRKNIDDIIGIILQRNLHVLFLDTCSLLDIIRCVERDKIAILDAALKIVDDSIEKQEKYLIIFPSLFEKEWNDNYEKVKNKTKQQIKNIDTCHNNIIKVYNKLFQLNINENKFVQFGLDEELLDLSKGIIDFGIIAEEIEKCKLKGVDRAIHGIPPATRAKSSPQDCIIFEELLFLSESLRNKGFGKLIVFVSSNTREYFDNNKIKDVIANDLDSYNIEIVKSLNHGYHRVST